MPMIKGTEPVRSQQKLVPYGSTTKVKERKILFGFKKKYLLVIAPVLLILGLLFLYLFFIRGEYKAEIDKTPIITVIPEKISTKSASKSADNLLEEETKDPSKSLGTVKGNYEMSVLVIKYFPLANNGKNIDINVTGDVNGSLFSIKQKTIDITNNLVSALEESSSYLGYKDPKSEPSLKYEIIDTKEYKKAFPIIGGTTNKPDYNRVMRDHDICDYVETKNVSEVWIWAYQGPGPQLGISESKMSGPFGDISNSYRLNDMPVCKSTYRVYTFNYQRGTAEALESWSHQMEAELDAIDEVLFRDFFQGSVHPQTSGEIGRCGSVHNPPNAKWEYHRDNSQPSKSDCLDWDPNGLGKLSLISCKNWGCSYKSDSDNPALNYMIWNWQNLPGKNNDRIYKGNKLRNYWEVHGDFDNFMKDNK